ncbi:Microtubule-destabilizing protein 60 [Cardamine amara subsp. amara]|uniref:Microtubule-destabilizing protein 60 n=1 Tax=Cardamine amara subsp. amara TaxID=228776 RepID=A0ABD1BB39_CARAN
MDSIRFQSKAQEISKFTENSNPNVPHATPARISGSLLAKSSKSARKNSKSKPNPSLAVFSPRNRIRERRFVVVKKNSRKEKNDSASVDCKCGAKANANLKKCVCVAYETLRASQEEFFRNRNESESEIGESSQNVEEGDEVEVGESDEIGVSSMKRRREKVLEEARMSLPEYGKVMHLVKAFEKLTFFPFSKAATCKEEGNQTDDKIKKPLKWELPGMSLPKCPEDKTDQVTWSSSFSSSDLVLTATNLGLEQPHASVSSSWDNSVSILNSNGGRRSRRTSLDSSVSMGSRRSKKKQIKVTSLKPFKLRTEERGRMKEEEFAKKLQEMTLEEGKMRIPIAQGLPWTTDESENLVRPHVKDITIPVDLKLHSDIRAVERAEFDYQVAEKINLIEQYKTERERQQKLAEEEEIRRLRKELIPKAQPMPYFDRPFIPKRSNKHPTIPRDPKFNIPQYKKIRCDSTSSWSETGSYMSDLLYQQDL